MLDLTDPRFDTIIEHQIMRDIHLTGIEQGCTRLHDQVRLTFAGFLRGGSGFGVAAVAAWAVATRAEEDTPLRPPNSTRCPDKRTFSPVGALARRREVPKRSRADADMCDVGQETRDSAIKGLTDVGVE